MIVATSVIEEGFDVPEANVVVSYDDLKDTVELCQRFGRARQTASSLTLMSERRDRPLSALKEVKAHQDSIIKDFKPSQSNRQHHMARQQSQNDRERSASSVLQDIAHCKRSPLECLNMYAAKTKGVVDKEYIREGDSSFECKMKYTSMNRTFIGNGRQTTKKRSQHLAALNIIEQLREDDRRRGIIK